MSAMEPTRQGVVASGGVLLVTTENGSLYRIDFDRLRVLRHADLTTGPGLRLRRDDEELRLLAVLPIVVGEPMKMMLDLREDGVPTARQTGNVTFIEWLT